MSDHLIQHRLEAAAASYLSGVVGSVLVAHLTEDNDVIPEATSIFVLCQRADGHPSLPGCYACVLTVELRTALMLHSSRAVAVAAHYEHWGTIADAMMQDDLDTKLVAAGESIGINGIEPANQLRHDNTNGMLVNGITRTIHAVPKTLT